MPRASQVIRIVTRHAHNKPPDRPVYSELVCWPVRGPELLGTGHKRTNSGQDKTFSPPVPPRFASGPRFHNSAWGFSKCNAKRVGWLIRIDKMGKSCPESVRYVLSLTTLSEDHLLSSEPTGLRIELGVGTFKNPSFQPPMR